MTKKQNLNHIVLFPIVCLLTLLNACKESPNTTTNFGQEEVITSQSPVSNGISYNTVKDANSLILEDGYTKGGEKQGTWVAYGNSGKITKTTSYISGKKHGLEMDISSSGKLSASQNYSFDKLNGSQKKYINGLIIEEQNYKSGELHGQHKTYYTRGSDLGKIQKLTEYKDGKVHGKIQYYNTEGDITLEYVYENGERISGGEIKNK